MEYSLPELLNSLLMLLDVYSGSFIELSFLRFKQLKKLLLVSNTNGNDAVFYINLLPLN